MELAPFGIVGFETAFPLLYTKFVKTGRWSLGFLLRTDDERPGPGVRPADGRLEAGAPADLTLIDLERRADGRSGEVSVEEPQHAVCRLAAAGLAGPTIVAGRMVWQAD